LKAALLAVFLLAITAVPRSEVVKPGTHPGILFSRAELPALRTRARSTGLAGEAWMRIKKTAASPASADLTVKQAVGRDGQRLASQLAAMSLVYQVEGDKSIGLRAVDLFLAVLERVDPFAF